MRAAVIADGTVTVQDRTDPVAGTGQILVAVRSAGINAADLGQLRGRYTNVDGPDDLPGLEFAGEVEQVGPDCRRFAPGDRVMGLVANAAQAELCVVHERQAMPVPEGLPWSEAGGLPEAFITAYDALFVQAGLRMGERLLVNGANGGVGTAAVQLGVSTGATVVAAVRSGNVRAQMESLGAVVADFESSAQLGPFDVILELIGAENLERNITSLESSGRIVVIGISAGGSSAEIDLRTLMRKRASISGSTLRTRSLEEKATCSRLLEKQVLPQFASRELRVPVDQTFTFDRIADAYAHFEAPGKLGKVVLEIG